MKKTLRFMMVAFVALTVTMTSCKKTDTTEDNNSELTTHSDDQSRFAGEIDAAVNDQNAAIESYMEFSGRPQNVLNIPCDVTAVLDSTLLVRRITLTYNGNVCPGARRTRTGTVVFTIPLTQRWRDVNAEITATVTNLKITRISDNKSITINGVHKVKNVTGGLLVHLGMPGAQPIIHDISSPGMSVTFDNNSQRTWQVSKRRTFSYNNGIVITTVGTHSDGTLSNISEWGTTRFGSAFVTSITIPMVIRQDCGFRLVSGQVTHSRLASNVVVTFGLDSAGNPTTCPAGVFYYKLVWTGSNGVVRTVILPY